jgi:hypothetical protein
LRVTWHPSTVRWRRQRRDPPQAEVLIILGVEGLAPCRHPAILSIKGRLFSRELPDSSVVERKNVVLEDL